MEYTFYQIDSFTKERFKGNPAGVVYNASGLSTEEMQLIAKEVNNSETAFLLPAERADNHGRIRYFTPKTEVPICGHATIAAMYVKAIEEQCPSSTFLIETKAGTFPFSVIKGIYGDYSVEMIQGNIEFFDPFESEMRRKVVNALGITATELDERCPIQIVTTGHSKVLVGVKTRNTLNCLKPKMDELVQLSSKINSTGFFVFTLEYHQSGLVSHGRMFAPAIGVNEDPVTGNANGPLGAYLVKHQIEKTKKNSLSFTGYQGEAINRLGKLQVQVDIKDAIPIQVKITGEAVLVFKTTFEI